MAIIVIVNFRSYEFQETNLLKRRYNFNMMFQMIGR